MICSLIIKYATKYSLKAVLLASIVHQESSLNPKAINDTARPYSYGLGQLIESTALGTCGLKKKDIMDPDKNLDCTAKYLSYQINRYPGNVGKAISAYNAGTFTKRNRQYVDDVINKSYDNICRIHLADL